MSLSQTPSLTGTVEVAGRRRDRAVFDLHSLTNSTTSKPLPPLSVSSSSWAYHSQTPNLLFVGGVNIGICFIIVRVAFVSV